MNWVLITVLAILAICGYAGWRKGIIKMIVSVAAMIVTIIATVFAAPLLGKIIKNSTKIYDNLYNSVEIMVSEALEKAEGGTKIYIDGDESEIQTYLSEVAKILKLPESIAVRVGEDVDYDYIEEFQERENTTVNTLVLSIISQRLAQIIFNAIIHIIVFIALFMVIRIVMSVTGIIECLPVIHEANKLLGLAVGLIEGLLIVWVFFALITAMGSAEWAVNALADINSSKLLSLIYDNNLILKSVFRTLD